MNDIAVIGEETDQLHRDYPYSLHWQAWASEDMLTAIEAMADDNLVDLYLARVMLDGAKDASSRGVASLVIEKWLGRTALKSGTVAVGNGRITE